jgi:hypothetical protein
MNRKKIKSSRYLAAFALTLVIFLIGYILGVMISEAKLQKVYGLSNEIRIESLGNELLFQLIERDDCGSINISTYTSELSTMGRRLTYMEELYGFDAPQVKQLKNYYSLLLIRHWMLSELLNDNCGADKPSVLYFYTNIGECEDCEDQGLVLTSVHKEQPEFHIYSFEYYQTNPALEYLKQGYNVTPSRLPTLVIDGEIYHGFRSKDFLKEQLNLS